MILTWYSRDPDALAARLDTAGIARSRDGFGLGDPAVRLRVEAATRGADERLVADGQPEHSRSVALAAPALGWASVDALRLAAEAGWTLEPLPQDDVLGAWAWLVMSVRPVTVLLEPSTEGPTAAALARHGEGPIAIYGAAGERAESAGARATPLGRGGLDLPSRWGPFLVVVSAAFPRVPSSA